MFDKFVPKPKEKKRYHVFVKFPVSRKPKKKLASWTLSPCSEVDEIEGVTHCKGPIQKIRKTYSQKRNCAPTVPTSAFMCL